MDGQGSTTLTVQSSTTSIREPSLKMGFNDKINVAGNFFLQARRKQDHWAQAANQCMSKELVGDEKDVMRLWPRRSPADSEFAMTILHSYMPV